MGDAEANNQFNSYIQR